MLSLPQDEVTADDYQSSIQSLYKFDRVIKYTSFALVFLFVAFIGYYVYAQRELSSRSYDSQAISAAKEVIRKYPRNPDARVRLGVVYANEGQYNKAIEQYDLAIKLVRDHQEALVYAGIAYLKKEQPDEALQYFNKEIRYYKNTRFSKTNTFLEQAYYYSGIIFWQKKDYDKALGFLNEAVDIVKTNADTYMVIGRVYIEKKDYDRAIAAFDKAIRFDSKYIDALYGLGVAYEGKGDKKEALKRYLDVLKVDPGYQLAQEAVARLKLK